MPEHNQHTSSYISEEEIILRWNVHLALEHPAKLILSIILTVVACAAGYWAIGPFGAIAAAVVMLSSLADFLFPMTYEITPQSATCKMLFKCATVRWEDVRRCYVDSLGVKLSPLDRQSKLEAFRGVYLRFRDNQEQVIKVVKKLRIQHCSEPMQ